MDQNDYVSNLSWDITDILFDIILFSGSVSMVELGGVLEVEDLHWSPIWWCRRGYL